MSEERSSRPTPPSGKPTPAQSTPRGRIAPGAFQPDYSHVIKDLRRIARLAGGILIVLLVLSFILR